MFMIRNDSKTQRIWELDFFRGLALIMMIYFHIVFDLKDIYGFDINYSSGINYYIGKISAILFMLISGMSCCLSRSNVKRGLKVLAIAMVITAATHLYDSGLGVKFGILHFLGVSMLLFPLFKNVNHYLLMLIGTVIIIAGNIFTDILMSHDYLFMFNLTSSAFSSSDYYPLLPWFGVFLFGISIAKILYKEKKSIFSFSIKDNIISRAGRNTLIIYVIHQPIIIAVLELIYSFKK